MESIETIDLIAAQIDLCENLLLREISEPSENSLRLLIDEAITLPEEESLKLPGLTLSGRPIKWTEETALFELIWDRYIVYSVIDESYAGPPDNSEVYAGRLFRVFSRSHFLDYISRATFASAEYPGPFRHFEVVCQNHVVNVASTIPPHIRWLRRKLKTAPASPILIH